MSITNPDVGNRTYTVVMLLSVLSTVVWGLANQFDWDPTPVLATLGGLGTVFGIHGMGEWRNRARIAESGTAPESDTIDEEA